MRRGHVLVLLSVLLSVLLATLLVGCSVDEKPADNKELFNKPPTKTTIIEIPTTEIPTTEIPPTIQETEETFKEIEQKIARAKAGLPTDFTGDGHEEYLQETDENGVLYVEVRGSPENPYSYISVTQPDGFKESRYSANAGTIIDVQEEFSNGKMVKLYDTDGDGHFDKQETYTFNSDDQSIRVVVEEGVPGAWNLVSDDVVRPFGDSSENASIIQSLKAFAASDTSIANLYGGLRIKLNPNGLDNGCTKTEHAKLAKAFADMFNPLWLQCLEATNPRLAAKLTESIGNEPNHLIQCGKIKAGADATTDQVPWWMQWVPGDNTITFNRDSLANLSSSELQTVVLHEYLHALGEGWTKDHENGVDEVYSCSRYCGGCSQRGMGAPQNSNMDCMRCAANSERGQETAACGYKAERTPVPCRDTYSPIGLTNAAICHQGFANCLCETCIARVLSDCNGNPLSKAFPLALCCDACPSNCSHSNDRSCDLDIGFNHFTSHDSCNQPPPYGPGGKRNP